MTDVTSQAIYFLGGLPCSGKSTIRKKMIKDIPEGEIFTVYSTDDDIEALAHNRHIPYADAFPKYIERVTATNNIIIGERMKHIPNNTVIWDQTNLTKKSRIRKLAQVEASELDRIMIWVEVNHADIPELNTAIRARREATGKGLPNDILAQMSVDMTVPTYDEGWDEIWVVNMHDIHNPFGYKLQADDKA